MLNVLYKLIKAINFLLELTDGLGMLREWSVVTRKHICL